MKPFFLFYLLVLVLMPIVQCVELNIKDKPEIGTFTVIWKAQWREYRRLEEWRLSYLEKETVTPQKSRIQVDYKTVFENESHSILKSTISFTAIKKGTYKLTYLNHRTVHGHTQLTNKVSLDYEQWKINLDFNDLLPQTETVTPEVTKEKRFKLDIYVKARENERVILDPVTVGACGSVGCTSMPARSTFRSETTGNYYYAFYCNGTDYVYSVSSDGSVWESPEIVYVGVTTALHVEVEYFPDYNDTRVYFTWGSGHTLHALYFMRGIINATGNGITWGTMRTVKASSSILHFAYPAVGVAMNGTAYVLCCAGTSTNHRTRLFWNSNNDGSGAWTLIASFSDNPSYVAGEHHRPEIVLLENNYTYAMWNFLLIGKGKNFTKGWGGAIEQITPSMSERYYSAVSNLTHVYFAFRDSTHSPNPKAMKIRNPSGSWLSKENITTTSTVMPGITISINLTTNDIYAYYSWNVTAHGLGFNWRNNTSGLWNTPALLFSGEATSFGTTFTSTRRAQDNKIGLKWETGIIGTHYIRYYIHNITPSVPPPPSEVGYIIPIMFLSSLIISIILLTEKKR